MRKQHLTRRGWVVLVIIPIILFVSLFTYATRDICYVGTEYGNILGYGSCNAMLDRVINGGK
jgi:hypothetical protein